jgi:protein arginine kinase activator
MTPCENCHNAPATVHITQITETQTTMAHLCETCAREKGIMVEIKQDCILPQIQVQAVPLQQAVAAPAAKEDERECRHCHLKFSEFKTKGRLGCPRCYDEFEKDVDAILKQIHGTAVHRGKRYSPRNADLMAGSDLARLHRELSDAIKREEFELAALLRDTIRNLDAKQTLSA